MNNLELMGQIAFATVIVFFAVIAFLYMHYWAKLKKTYKEERGTSLNPSQEELSAATKESLVEGSKMVGDSMFKASYVIFKMKTDNPALQKTLRGIRMTLLAFVLFPFVLGAVLIALTIMMTS